MMQTIRTFLLLEALAVGTAALVHRGVILEGYEHPQAFVAETVIACVLLAGLGWSLLAPGSTRRAGIVSQTFALLGTCVGLLTIALGVGPQSAPDLVYHLLIVVVLAYGLVLAVRGRGESGDTPNTFPAHGARR